MAGRLDPVVDRVREGTVSETVVASVAAVQGIDPREMEPLLYDVLDPDALDRLFRTADGGWNGDGAAHVEFRLAGCHVLVRDTGHVVVTSDATSEGR